MLFPTFRPHPLLRGGHAQTVAGAFWPGKLNPYRAVHRRIRLDDADVPEQLRRAAAVNPAIDLAACAVAMARPIARWYDRHLVSLLWQQLQRRSRAFPAAPACDFSRIPRAVAEFDELFTAPVAGF